MANGETWPAEGYPINDAFRILFPIAWASYYYSKRKAYSDRQQPFVGVGTDAHRRLEAYHHAQNKLEVELCRLLELQRFELWGRFNSPAEEARHIPASVLWPQGVLKIDFEACKADGQGVPVFDLRLRRKVLHATLSPAPRTPVTRATQASGQARLARRILLKLYPPSGVPPDEKSKAHLTAEIAAELEQEQKEQEAQSKSKARGKDKKTLRAPSRDGWPRARYAWLAPRVLKVFFRQQYAQ